MLPTQKESPDQPKSLFLANAVDWMKVLGRTNLKIRPQDCAEPLEVKAIACSLHSPVRYRLKDPEPTDMGTWCSFCGFP